MLWYIIENIYDVACEVSIGIALYQRVTDPNIGVYKNFK